MLYKDVAAGIHRIEDAYTNWYLVEGDGGLCIVDAGVPTSWRSLHSALRDIGRRPDDVRALVLTHAHFDHVGFAERARTELPIPFGCTRTTLRWRITRATSRTSATASRTTRLRPGHSP